MTGIRAQLELNQNEKQPLVTSIRIVDKVSLKLNRHAHCTFHSQE